MIILFIVLCYAFAWAVYISFKPIPFANEDVEQWVSALESGKYKQTTGALRKPDGFCCLGVACNLAGYDWTIDGPYATIECAYGYVHSKKLPNELKYKLHLHSDAGGPRVFNGMKSLITLNDDGMSFKEIARTLRNYREVYFTGM